MIEALILFCIISDQWLFDYPAQVSLCGTQIAWTSEVGVAFGKLEEGYWSIPVNMPLRLLRLREQHTPPRSVIIIVVSFS